MLSAESAQIVVKVLYPHTSVYYPKCILQYTATLSVNKTNISEYCLLTFLPSVKIVRKKIYQHIICGIFIISAKTRL